MDFITHYLIQLGDSCILFSFTFAGFILESLFKLKKSIIDFISKLTFNFMMPVMLFEILSKFSSHQNADYRLIYVYFGCSFCVYLACFLISKNSFKLSGTEAAVFSISCIYANTLIIGLAMAKLLLGNAAMPMVALIVAFNTFLLWTLVLVSVELTNVGRINFGSLMHTMKSMLTNPIIIGMLLGFGVDFMQIPMPLFISQPIHFIAESSSPLLLFVLGIALAQYKISENLKLSVVICSIKLLVMPVVIFCVSVAIGLPELETNAIVLLGSIAIGVNVYIMAFRFDAMQSAIASSLLLSTMVSVVTTPLILTIATYIR